MPRLRLIFMGSPDFALPTLAALADAGHDIVCVYTQPPRPAGRGLKEHPSPVHAEALRRGIDVRAPAKLSDADAGAFRARKPDAAVVVAYGLILPKTVLAAPRLGCLNVHASLLPRWRGAAPIQRAILAGDHETGVSIMRITEGLDEGPVYMAREVPITDQSTAQSLHDTLSRLGADLMVETLDGVAAGALTPKPQLADGVCYAAKLTPDEGRLGWSQPAAALERRVRALAPRPGAWLVHDAGKGAERIKVLEATAEAAPAPVPEGARPGTIIDDGFGILAADGVLRPRRVQRPGKAAQERAQFLRGYPLAPGTRLE